METETIIKELTQEDLVNLLCTATYGSYWLECYAPFLDGVAIDDSDCLEDVWAKALLEGKALACVDHYAEGESYGTIPCVVEEEGDATYYVTLQDIKDGLKKCADGTFKVTQSNYGESEKRWLTKCYKDFNEDDGEMDNPEAEALMQVIMFGELIYG